MDERRDPLTPSAVRRLLGKTLPTKPELDAFCVDYFPEVSRRFTDEMDRTTKVNLLLMQVPLVELVNRLLAEFPIAAQIMAQSMEDSATSLEPLPPAEEEPGGRSANKVPVVWCSFAAPEEELFGELAEHLSVLGQQGVLTLRPTRTTSAAGASGAAHAASWIKKQAAIAAEISLIGFFL